MHDWKQTPPLDEFNVMYDEDDNVWWRIGCGHHMNLYDAAVERYQTGEHVFAELRKLHAPKTVRHPQGDYQACKECLGVYPCSTIRILDRSVTD